MRRSRRSKVSNAQTIQERREEKSPIGPDSKPESRIRLLLVDPYLLHAYWEIIDEDLETARSQLVSAGTQVKPVLRFYDITYIVFDGKNSHGFFDVEIDLTARNWYVHLWSPEKSYCADLGLKTPEGRLLTLARSNVAHTPAVWPSISEEERDVPVIPKPEISTASAPCLSVPSREEFAVASPKEKELNPATLSTGRGNRSFDLPTLSEQYFCGGISSWRSRNEGD